MKLLLRCLAIISASASSIVLAGEKPAVPEVGQPFVLSVVPSRSSRFIAISDDRPDEFYVVLTNASNEAQPVFETWNSWGYQAVSFEVTMPDGRKFVASKRQEEFTRNFPSTFLIPPGEHQVYSIRLDKKWETHPSIGSEAEMQVAFKAIYEVGVTHESTEHRVWTGRVESKVYNLTLRHW